MAELELAGLKDTAADLIEKVREFKKNNPALYADLGVIAGSVVARALALFDNDDQNEMLAAIDDASGERSKADSMRLGRVLMRLDREDREKAVNFLIMVGDLSGIVFKAAILRIVGLS